jgi:hypothetical protein
VKKKSDKKFDKKPVDHTTRNDIIKLCLLAIAVELAVFAITVWVLNLFVDSWGMKVYLETILAPFVLHGQYPYVDYFWEYPIVMVLFVFIAAIPAIVADAPQWFFYTFPALMTVCNLAVVALTYILTLKIYGSRKRAIIAGFLYATAFTAAYITMTNFDPIPTMFVMLGLTLTIYGGERMKSAGYLSYIFGFFTKIYPVAILPFLALYNAKKSNIKDEIVTIIKVGIIPFLILFVPIYLLNPASIDTYLIRNAAGKEIFVASFVYTIYAWLNGMIGLPVTVYMVSTFMTFVLIGTFVVLGYLAYKYPYQNPVFLLQVTLVALVAIIACSKYHSPQYMMWIMPILCVLIAGNLVQMGIFYFLQALWFIKFPVAFWEFYTNNEYTNPIRSAGGSITLMMFTVEYLALFYLVYSIVKRRTPDVSS